MITKVTCARWTNPNGKMGFCHTVYYDTGRKVTYTDKQTLPMTVLNFIMNTDTSLDIEYVHDSVLDKTTKRETYTI